MLDIKNNFKNLNDCYRNYKMSEKLQEDNRYFVKNVIKKE